MARDKTNFNLISRHKMHFCFVFFVSRMRKIELESELVEPSNFFKLSATPRIPHKKMCKNQVVKIAMCQKFGRIMQSFMK